MNNNENPSAQEVREQTSHEEISRRAQELWRQYGCPQGRDDEIWFEAERQLRGTQPESLNVPLVTPAREEVRSEGAHAQLGVPPVQGAPVSVVHQPSNTELMEKAKPGPAAKTRGKSKK